MNLNTISSELSKTQIDIRDNYSTTVQVNNAITQAITKESNSIKLEVSNNYATKKSLESYATNESLKSYATSASLDLYIKKDPTSGELKSAIEAIADDITLKAKGAINISGNKSVNINGDLFTLTTTNTTISADGTITCKKLNAKGSTIGGYTINDYTLVGEQVGISSKSGYAWAFWAGSDTPENSVFKVGHDGSLYAKSAHITGGDIDINTSTLSISAIKLNYGSRHAKMSPYQISYTSDEYESFMDADGFAILDKSGNSISELRDKSLMLNQGDCYVYGYYYISSGGAWVELSEWIKQKLGI